MAENDTDYLQRAYRALESNEQPTRPASEWIEEYQRHFSSSPFAAVPGQKFAIFSLVEPASPTRYAITFNASGPKQG